MCKYRLRFLFMINNNHTVCRASADIIYAASRRRTTSIRVGTEIRQHEMYACLFAEKRACQKSILARASEHVDSVED